MELLPVLVLDMIEILTPLENINTIPREYSRWSATLKILCPCGDTYETSTDALDPVVSYR
jgi:hypothetical protein